ncbi:MAG TPA: histidine kinase dimerization/phosphoacceptor domain -containing protein [Phenylobacterium sp.]|nr:histidine kinase dimerization/phosphoacceptor domain -containing protein [Phenylobacterium sp.]
MIERDDESNHLLDAIMKHLPSGLTIATASDLSILRVSDFGLELLGREPDELTGVGLEQHPDANRIFHPDGTPASFDELPLSRATLKGEVVRNEEWLAVTADGREIPLICNAGPIRDQEDRILGGVNAWADISRQKNLERELREAVALRDALIREIHHRVKNHLQIAGMIIRRAARENPSTAELAEIVASRLQVIAAVHDSLYRAAQSDSIEAAGFLSQVCDSLSTPDHPIHLEADSGLSLDARTAGPIGMILSEALTNCLKHAFADEGGDIFVSLTRSGPGRMVLRIRDQGVGAKGVERSSGVQLMRVLSKQLEGEFHSGDRPGGGHEVSVEFPAPREAG